MISSLVSSSKWTNHQLYHIRVLNLNLPVSYSEVTVLCHISVVQHRKDFCCFSLLLLFPVGYSFGVNNSFILCAIYNFYSQHSFIWFLSMTVEEVSERAVARSEWLSVFSSDISRRRPDLSSGFSRLLATAQHTTETVNTYKAALCSLPWWQTSLKLDAAH